MLKGGIFLFVLIFLFSYSYTNISSCQEINSSYTGIEIQSASIANNFTSLDIRNSQYGIDIEGVNTFITNSIFSNNFLDIYVNSNNNYFYNNTLSKYFKNRLF